MLEEVFKEENLLEAFKRYREEICSTCKTECTENLHGICVVYTGKSNDKTSGRGLYCIDYKKDETKIKPTEKPIIPTAKHTKPIMDKLV